MKGGSRRSFIGGSLGMLAGCALAQEPRSINERMQGEFAPVHDPSVIRQDDWYYVFSTNIAREQGGFIPIRRSRDLVTWEKCGFVFAAIPEWARDSVPKVRGLWAPDISRVGDRYLLYYSVSSFGSNRSAIGLATNTTLDHSALPNDHVQQGGLSGAPLRARATHLLGVLSSQISLPLIASGGVMDVASAKEKFDAGACLVQIYTGLVYRGPQLIREIASLDSELSPAKPS